MSRDLYYYPDVETDPLAQAIERLDQVTHTHDLVGLRRLIQPLSQNLHEVRLKNTKEEWRRTIPLLRSHQAFERLLRDPYTNRAFHKPRGYAGDAVMLDYIYRPAFCDLPELVSDPDGVAIFSYTTMCPAARAVQNRRALLARLVDNFPAQRPIRVASLACGHLREAELMNSLSDRSLERLFAIDQDPESIQVCVSSFAGTPVVPILGSVVDLLRGQMEEVRDLDIFYAAGLLDYLSDRLSARLLSEMFSRLTHNGTLLVANFTPATVDIGYMEAFMDWWLTYRDEDDLVRLAAGLPANEIKAVRTFREAEQNIAFLEITRGWTP